MKFPATVIVLLSFCMFPAASQNVLTIERALEFAQENSPAVKQELMSIERNRLNLKAQRAALKSNFSLTLNPVGYSVSRKFRDYDGQWYTSESFQTGGSLQIVQPILLTDGVISLRNNFSWQNSSVNENGVNVGNNAFLNSLTLNLEQPLFLSNSLKRALKQNEFALENAEISYALKRLQLESDITSDFYAVFNSQSTLETAKSSFVNSKKNYEIIKNKTEAELAPKEELYQIMVTLAKDSASVESAIVQLENAKDKLKRTVGMNLDEEFDVKAEIDVKAVTVDEDMAVEHAFASRLELRRREIEAKLSEYSLIVEKEKNRFNGKVGLSLGLTGNDPVFGDMYSKPTQSPSVGVTFTVPIFDWGENRARVKAKELEIKSQELEAGEERIDIVMYIRQECRALRNLQTQVEIAEQNIINAQLTYDLNMVRYRNGDLSGMGFVQFQTQLTSAKNDYTNALIKYKESLLRLKILSLYDFERNVEVVPLSDYSVKSK
ncbi:MAG: TolC family protein [Dysgonamonadaceae bacterium]|jgi:outer membrane protein TolC|nr:TolC family protein [Dysgonamonadaceae bacterium]